MTPSAQTDSPTLAEHIDLATKLRHLRPEIRRSVMAIAGPLAEPSHVDSRTAFDIVAGLIGLATVNPVGGPLRDQTAHVLALVLGSPRGSSLTETLATLSNDRSAAFAGICAIVAEVRL